MTTPENEPLPENNSAEKADAEVADVLAQAETVINDAAQKTASKPPETGEESSAVKAAETVPEPHPDTALAAERLADLQRLQAEYFNYKKRVDRDREAAKDMHIGIVVESLLPVLDDIYLAREHGELSEGPMAKIASKLEEILGKHGVDHFGEIGDSFDPTIHEALMTLEVPTPEGSTGTTVVQVMQRGYRIGERLVRPALVGVAEAE